MTRPSIIAIVPMRHESERVPGKNYRDFAGRPLFYRVLESLLACPLIAEVVIDTDSPTVRANASCDFPHVRVLERPAELRAGTVAMNDILKHVVSQLDGEFYLQTHSTNPLLTTATISRAIERFLGALENHDSLFSVTRQHKRFWTARGEPLNHDPAILQRTQDLTPVFEENSSLYLFGRALILTNGNRIGRRPILFETDALESWDIDNESDFLVAEMLFRTRSQGGSR